MATNILGVNSIIAKEALMLLKNNLVMADRVYRGLEGEFKNRLNGYTPGETVSMRRPAQHLIGIGPTIVPQDTIEGSIPLTVNRQVNAAVSFTGVDMTLRAELPDIFSRIMKNDMIRMADQVDRDVMALFTNVNNWVGTPGAVLSNYASFAAGTQRMDDGSVPLEGRCAVLSPADKAGLVSAIANAPGLFNQAAVEKAYRRGMLGDIDNVDAYMSQNVPTLTTGTRTNGTNNSGVPTTYTASRDTGTQTLPITGLGANATISAGEVFTLAGVFDVNPVNQVALPFLKQFAVTTAATASGGGAATVTIRPAMILVGPYQNISAAPAAAAVLTWRGAASTAFRQNMIFQEEAFALAIVPMIRPPGAVDVSRMTQDGISIRAIPIYDGTNDNNVWRLDILYGISCMDERLAVRLSGT